MIKVFVAIAGDMALVCASAEGDGDD